MDQDDDVYSIDRLSWLVGRVIDRGSLISTVRTRFLDHLVFGYKSGFESRLEWRANIEPDLIPPAAIFRICVNIGGACGKQSVNHGRSVEDAEPPTFMLCAHIGHTSDPHVLALISRSRGFCSPCLMLD